MAVRYRDLCCSPAQFGEVLEAQFWLTPPDGAEPYTLIGAVFQHRLAVLMKAGLTERGMSQARYAKEVGMTQDRLTRLLRGYYPMSPIDIATAIATLDPQGTWVLDPAHWLGVATAAERGSEMARQATESAGRTNSSNR